MDCPIEFSPRPSYRRAQGKGLARAFSNQRPLKIQKYLKGPCSLEPKKQRAEKAQLVAQRFREIEAAVLGAQWVAERGDPVLAGAARDLIAKIETAVPERLRPFIAEPTIGAPPGSVAADGLDIAQTRAWIRSGRKIRIRYRNQLAQVSQRTIWPVIIGYAETVRLLAAWCELRQDFRHFRTDRIIAAQFLDERHGSRPADLRTRWKRHVENERGVRLP